MSTLRKSRAATEEFDANPSVESTDTSSRKAARRKGGPVKAIFIIIILALLGYGGYDYYKKSNELRILKDPALQSQLAEKQSAEIVATVGQHIVLPADETPTILTIQDAAALAAEQPFYKDAVNGDLVLVYQTAAKAILWSPTRKIVVNVGPVVQEDAPANNTNQRQTQTQTQTQSSGTSSTDSDEDEN